jgi:hypothetical protein
MTWATAEPWTFARIDGLVQTYPIVGPVQPNDVLVAYAGGNNASGVPGAITISDNLADGNSWVIGGIQAIAPPSNNFTGQLCHKLVGGSPNQTAGRQLTLNITNSTRIYTAFARFSSSQVAATREANASAKGTNNTPTNGTANVVNDEQFVIGLIYAVGTPPNAPPAGFTLRADNALNNGNTYRMAVYDADFNNSEVVNSVQTLSGAAAWTQAMKSFRIPIASGAISAWYAFLASQGSL